MWPGHGQKAAGAEMCRPNLFLGVVTCPRGPRSLADECPQASASPLCLSFGVNR